MWECTGCRRCVVFCPFDLDMGLLASVGRFSLLQEGLGLEMIVEIGNAEVNKGEIIDAVKEFYLDQVKTLEARLRNEFAPDLQILVEKEGRGFCVCRWLGSTPSSEQPRYSTR